ncbi:MAG: hypothetical protein AUJ49_01295 [Desulfovibrionaceae bacterium CG1_02_65_16]|nr:MAG: hypothetical protein AUJ49_01295 [Desulfovibrionaceae bacterium CG1_02_65_16]
MSFDKLLSEDRRLTVLLLLSKDAGYRLNAYVLRPALDAMGHTVSLDRVESDLAWLAEQGLVTVERVEGVTVARLTQRGADVAAGRCGAPGVKHREPGA